MERLIVLGTGYAMATKCYNTCFAVENESGVILTDAGGGNGILKQVENAGLDWRNIKCMIITHAHCDHILGAVWVLRKIGTMIISGAYGGCLKIFCHASVRKALTDMAKATLQSSIVRLFGDRILFCDIEDGTEHELIGYQVKFFDILSGKLLQYGFTFRTRAGKKLTCLGDEPYQTACGAITAGSDWLLCEAFCLYGERERFKPYEKHHSTVKDACELAEQMRIPHLVLWHTEDKNYENRQRLYQEEGKSYYSGDLRVPYDLDVIALD